MSTKKVIVIGGGPAGHEAATSAARFGAEVVLIERDVVGGAAHLHDCVPSKSMIATGGAMSFAQRIEGMGLATVDARIDASLLAKRIATIEERLESGVTQLLLSQGVRIIRGTGRLEGPHTVLATTDAGDEELTADVIVLATGSRPRLPDWAKVDGDRVLTTRDAYPPDQIMFTSLGSEVTLVVSRQQVLPQKDPEAAAVLEQSFLDRGVNLLKGARATDIRRDGDMVHVDCSDGRVASGSHALLAIGSIPNSEGLGLENAGVAVNDWGYVEVDHNLQCTVPHIYAAGDLAGKLPLSSVASMQGRKIAEHAMGLHIGRNHRHLDYDKAGDLHRSRDRRRRSR
jgi:pyruvate/2-oxoglutarate dehydrogenase complex dihydrolipoamide dehydrogenase (E3) component